MNANQVFNVNSLFQNGGITAGIVNVGKPDRHLDERLKKQLNANLKSHDEIVVTAVMGSVEAFEFASEIVGYLKENGHNVVGVNQAIYSKPVRGQILNRNDTNPNKVEIIIGGNSA